MFHVYCPDLKLSKLPAEIQGMIRAEQYGSHPPAFRSYLRKLMFNTYRYVLVMQRKPRNGTARHWNPKFSSESFQACCDWAMSKDSGFLFAAEPVSMKQGKEAVPALPEVQTPPAQPS